jgi:hypothetical protein
MVEIPRFKRKELNLGLVRKRGPGQRIAWVLLWLVWFINGLAGLVSSPKSDLPELTTSSSMSI